MLSMQEAKESAEHVSRMKSQFLANMSHELRTPMHAIISFSRIGLKRAVDEKTSSYFEKIIVSSERLTGLLNNLLDLSRLESGKMKTDFTYASLSLLLKDVINQLESLLLDKHIRVETRAEQDIHVSFDHNLMMQVLINLFSNAIKFSPENSVITVNLEHIVKTRVVRITITDQGIGIPVGELDQVFDAFVQSSKTDTGQGGTGLGLPICQQIIELHNGKIWAESPVTDAGGTSMVFEIPALNIEKKKLDSEDTSSRSFFWDERFSVGHALLDSQHKKIIDLINELSELVGHEYDTSMINKVLNDLYEYIKEHLHQEERLLQEKGYPFLPGHRELHKDFRRKIDEFSAAAEDLPETFIPELIQFLQLWWNHHVLEEDMQYKRYFE